jgi:hypothetical protein
VPSKTPSEVSVLLIWLIDERLKLNGLGKENANRQWGADHQQNYRQSSILPTLFPSEALHGIPHPSLPLHHFLSIQAIEFNSYIDPIKSVIPSLLPSGG